FTRSDVEITVLKIPGTTFQKNESGQFTNLYNIEFVNKTFDEINLEIRVESPAGASLQQVGEAGLKIPAQGILKSVYFINMEPESISQMRTDIELGVYRDGERIE